MSGWGIYSRQLGKSIKHNVNYEMKVQTYDADVLEACGFRKVSTFAVTTESSTAVGGIQLCKKGVVGLSYEKSSPGSALQGFTCVMWQIPVPHGHLISSFGVLLRVAAGIDALEADATFSVPAVVAAAEHKCPNAFPYRETFQLLTPLELLALATTEP